MAETEKITINLSVVDLGKIDLLVEEGFYPNRTDFIRSAIRNQIDKHDFEVKQTIQRRSFVLGILIIGKEDLEKKRAADKKVSYHIIGMLTIQKDVTPELAKQVIESIRVLGVFNAPDEVIEALGDRIK